MARRSRAALNVLSFPTTGKPPSCHDKASPAIKAIFNEIVSSVSPTHFRASDGPLIEGLARAIHQARLDQANIDKHGAYFGTKVNPASKSMETQQKLIVSFTRSLRLSPHTRTDRKAKALQALASNHPKPWLHDENEELDD